MGGSGAIPTVSPIVIPAEAETPLHVTATLPVPGAVAVPITHDHETIALPCAVLSYKPAAVLSVPRGVWSWIAPDAFGKVGTAAFVAPR
jgi:hypothetical protein